MVNISTAVIPIFLMVVSGVLMWSTTYFKKHTFKKLFFIVVLNLLCLGAWYSVQSYAGWPSSSMREMTFQVLQVVIDEPDKRTNDPGYIYVYIRTNEIERDVILDALGYKAKDNEPYSLRLPYSRENHKEAQKMKEKLQRGEGVEGKIEKKVDGMNGNIYNLKDLKDVQVHEVPEQNVRNKPPSRK